MRPNCATGKSANRFTSASMRTSASIVGTAVRLRRHPEEILVQPAVTVYVLERHRGILAGRQILEVHDETLRTGFEYPARPLLPCGREGFGPVIDRYVDLAVA